MRFRSSKTVSEAEKWSSETSCLKTAEELLQNLLRNCWKRFSCKTASKLANVLGLSSKLKNRFWSWKNNSEPQKQLWSSETSRLKCGGKGVVARWRKMAQDTPQDGPRWPKMAPRWSLKKSSEAQKQLWSSKTSCLEPASKLLKNCFKIVWKLLETF